MKRLGSVLVTTVLTTSLTGVALVATGPAAAVPSPRQQAASTRHAAPLTVDNLGLSTAQATYVQCWLAHDGWGYTGPLDGRLGTESWQAFQRYLAAHRGYQGPIDGRLNPQTILALQRELADGWGYGPADGIVGPALYAAFRRFADAKAGYC
jgi:peptidoglycan hydrolase-like protein with peptidoglycan-binding domain